MQYYDLNQPTLPDPRVVSWLEANNIDPSSTPAVQYVQVAGGRIQYLEFMTGADGHRLPIHDGSGEVCAWHKRLVSKPLLSTPETHGLKEIK